MSTVRRLLVHCYAFNGNTPSPLAVSVLDEVAAIQGRYDEIFVPGGQHKATPVTVDQLMRPHLMARKVPKDKIIIWTDSPYLSEFVPACTHDGELALWREWSQERGLDPHHTPIDTLCIEGCVERVRFLNMYWGIPVQTVLTAPGQMGLAEIVAFQMTTLWPNCDSLAWRLYKRLRRRFKPQPDGRYSRKLQISDWGN